MGLLGRKRKGIPKLCSSVRQAPLECLCIGSRNKEILIGASKIIVMYITRFSEKINKIFRPVLID